MGLAHILRGGIGRRQTQQGRDYSGSHLACQRRLRGVRRNVGVRDRAKKGHFAGNLSGVVADYRIRGPSGTVSRCSNIGRRLQYVPALAGGVRSYGITQTGRL